MARKDRMPQIGEILNLFCLLNNGKKIEIKSKVTNVDYIKSHIVDTETINKRRISFALDKKNRVKKNIKGPRVLFYNTIIYNS